MCIIFFQLSFADAQEGYNGGLFGYGNPTGPYQQESLLKLEGTVINDGGSGAGFTNETFETPLGSGIAVLFAAGLSYYLFKKKED